MAPPAPHVDDGLPRWTQLPHAALLWTLDLETLVRRIPARADGKAARLPRQLATALARCTKRQSIDFDDLDAVGWLAWTLVGAEVFTRGPVTMKQVRDAARKVGVCLAMVRARGSISQVARELNVSRRAVRESLKGMGMYPWDVGART